MRRLFQIIVALGALFSLGISSVNAAETEAQRKMKMQYYYLEALRQKSAGNIGAAVDNLYRCNSLDNSASEVFAALADINMSYSYGSTAMGQMKKASELQPDNIYYRKEMAGYAVNLYDLKLATELYEELLQKDHKHKNIYSYYLANIYSTINEYEKAIGAWNIFEEEEGISETVSQEKFKLYLKLKKEKKAFAEIDKLIKSAPRETKHIALKGDLYMALGNAKKGELCYTDGLKKFPGDPVLLVRYGCFLAENGRRKEGMSKLLAVLEDPKVDYTTKHDLLYRIASDSVLDIADSYYLDMIKNYPQEEYPSLVYATVLLNRGDSTGIEYIRKTLEINPKHEDAWLTLLNYYVAKGDTTLFVNASQESVDQFPENPNLLDIHGMSKMMLKQKNEALESWVKASKLAVESGNYSLAAEVYAKSGDVLMQMRRADSCFAMYDSALVYGPNNVMVLNNYAYYLSVLNKDLDKAERYSLQTLKANPKSPVFLDTYAWICFKKGEFNVAKLYIMQAYANGGSEDPELLEHYADILFKSGTPEEECKKYWVEAYEKRQASEELRDYENYENLKRKAETGKYVE